MANDLVTLNEMSVWTATDLGTIASDQFATDVRAKVSDYLRFLAGHPEWTRETAPYDVKVIALWMVKRTYTNPDQETSTTIGPIGSRVLDDAALGMALTETEAATLKAYKDAVNGSGALWTATIATQAAPAQPTIFLPDDQQINIDSTNAAPSWDIPFTDPYDVNHL